MTVPKRHPVPDLTARLIARKLWAALWLRCPNCEQGRTFKGHLFKMEDKCARCDVRFERAEGESIGGVFIALTLAEALSVGGFFLFEALFRPSIAFQLAFWTGFIILFTVFGYRHMRGLWVGISYLTGGVYPDDPEPQNPAAIIHDPHEKLSG